MVDKNIQLTAGIFILLVLTGGITYILSEGDVAYYCEDTNTVGICFKLSKVNSNGLQTRCYYSQETPTKYKNCKSGWKVFNDTITGVPDNSSIGFDLNLSETKLETLRKLGIGTFPILNESCKSWDITESEVCMEYLNETCVNSTIEISQGECLQIDNSTIGYSEIEISPCVKINNYECKSKIYQKNGIDKDIIIEYNICTSTEYTEVNKTEILINKTCVELTKEQIENKLVNKSTELLNNIAEIRGLNIKAKEEMTDKLNINL